MDGRMMKMKSKGLLLVLFMVMFFAFAGCDENTDIEFHLNVSVDTIPLGEPYEDPGVTAKINGFIYQTEVTDYTVDTSEVGIYHITYTLDHLDRTLSLTRVVTVIDETPPEITLNPGIDTLLTGETWTDESVEVTDNSDGVIDIETIGSVDTSSPGTYEITYVATDEYGNQNETTRIVTVLDESR